MIFKSNAAIEVNAAALPFDQAAAQPSAVRPLPRYYTQQQQQQHLPNSERSGYEAVRAYQATLQQIQQ